MRGFFNADFSTSGNLFKKIILIYFFGTGGASTSKSVKGIPALRCNDFKVGPLTNSRARSPCPWPAFLMARCTCRVRGPALFFRHIFFWRNFRFFFYKNCCWAIFWVFIFSLRPRVKALVVLRYIASKLVEKPFLAWNPLRFCRNWLKIKICRESWNNTRSASGALARFQWIASVASIGRAPHS